MAQLQGGSGAQPRPRADGQPAPLRSGIQALSGLDMSGVRVHRNSTRPAALQAHAFAQGQDIHLGPGQEHHLPHEAWHVVQQARGQVRPGRQTTDGVAVNDEAALEQDADRMGAKALQMKTDAAEATLQRRGVPPAGLVQLDKGKQAREAEVRRVLKDGRARLGSSIGEVRPYLSVNEQNYIFLAGLIKGGFGFASLGRFLKDINSDRDHAGNAELQQDITLAFSKVISFKDDYTAVLGEGRREFREGRISEFQGLAGELASAAQFAKAGKTVTRLGHEYRYGGGQIQEVDVTVSSESGDHFVEVAATPSKLKDKLSGGLAGTYPQMQGYQALSREHAGSRVAYSCPTLAISQISPELIDKVARAGVQLVIAGEFHDAASLRKLVEQQSQPQETPKTRRGRKKRGGSHKQTERKDRHPRLEDRGERLTGKALRDQALRDYHRDEQAPHWLDETEESDGDSEDEGYESHDELSRYD